jgi:hypothetical protein
MVKPFLASLAASLACSSRKAAAVLRGMANFSA